MRLPILFLLLGLFIAPAAAGDGTRSGPWAGDPRFQRPVTLEAADQPLWEFLGHLRSDYDLPVRADDLTHDERITVFCQARPIGQVLLEIAKHLDYGWTLQKRKGEAEFVLTQPVAAQIPERQAREALLGLEVDQIRTQAERLRRHGAATGRDWYLELARDVQEERDRLRPGSDTHQFDEAIAAYKAGEIRHSHPDADSEALGVLLACLAEKEWSSLWAGERLSFSYPERPNRRTLSGGDATRLLKRYLELARMGSHDDGTTELGKFEAAEQLRADLRLSLTGQHPILNLRCVYLARTPEGREESTFQSKLEGFGQEFWKNPEPFFDSRDAELRRPVHIRAKPLAKGEPSPQLSDVLRALHPGVSFTLIGDSYDDRGTDRLHDHDGPLSQWLLPHLRSLNEDLHRERQTLYFRHRDHVRLRMERIPDRLVRAWEAQLPQFGGALPLSAQMEMARTARYPQLQTLFDRWQSRHLISISTGRLLRLAFEEQEDVFKLLALTGTGKPAGTRERLGGEQRELARSLIQHARSFFYHTDNPENAAGDLHPRPVGFEIALEDAMDAGEMKFRLDLQRLPAVLTFAPDGNGMNFKVAGEEEPPSINQRPGLKGRQVKGVRYYLDLYGPGDKEAFFSYALFDPAPGQPPATKEELAGHFPH